jgi:uncharacterized membrane protein YkvA (DUF1232 family)
MPERTPEMDQTAEEALRVDPLKLERDSTLVLSRFWAKLRDSLSRIPFAEKLIAAFYAATDPATPFRAKAILMGALAYFIMPVDAVPDFIAVLGFTDDAAVLMLALRTVSGAIQPRHHERARAWLLGHKIGPTDQAEIQAGPVIDH